MPQKLAEVTRNECIPNLYPELARTLAGRFSPNKTIAAGTVLAKRTSTGRLEAYNASLSDGVNYPVGICRFDIMTDANGFVYYSNSSTVKSAINRPYQTAEYWICGMFRASDLTGLDATAITRFPARTLPDGTIYIL